MSLRPPLFFTQRTEMKALCALSLAVLEGFLDRLGETEARAKRSGMPAEALVARLFLEICLGVAKERPTRHG